MTHWHHHSTTFYMKNSIKKAFVAALLASASFATAEAVPAYPKPISVKQPDGTTVTVRLRGDEHLNWMETTDGYTLLRDASGYITFAKADSKGFITPSTLRYTGTTLQAKAEGIKPGLRYAPEQRKAFAQAATPQTSLMVDGSFPTTGKHKLLVLLVNYSDTKTTYTQKNFDDMMNKEGYAGIGSFRDYYKEQSYGLLDIDVTVTDWITLPMSKATYGAEGAPYMIYDALSEVSKTIDLKQFDNDGDGILDGLAVIHQGTGQEMTGNTEDIWSHSSVIYGQTFNGISVRRYTIEPEVQAIENRMSTIGVICHEFGHALGAPDFYDTDYAESGGEYCGTGSWDLLGGGAWLGDYGDRPAGINGWQKYVFGWVTPTVLNNSTVVTDMPAADKAPVAYRMETGSPGEYFYMENRQQTGTFDASLPGHGLVIYHVNENLIRPSLYDNDFNASYPQGIYTVCSDAGVDPEATPASYGKVNSAAAPFPGEYGHTDFSDRTLPSTHSLDGRFAYRALSNITDVDGKVGFTFTHEAEPPKPTNLKATTASGNVVLTWNIPDDTEQVDHYTVYCNNEKVGTTKQTSFTHEKPTGGTLLSYMVDATYENELISHPTQVNIMVPGNKVTGVTPTVAGTDVQLNWTTDNRLTWANTDMSKLNYEDIDRSELTYANYFSAANLATYVGGKITRMGFVPMQGPSEISVKLKIYECDEEGHNLVLVSERDVKEFAKAQPRDLKLTQPVTIEAGKNYLVAVENVGKNGVVTVACDKNTVVDGYGNCVIFDGKAAKMTDAYGNFYVTATVTMPSDDAGADIDAAPSEEADPAFDFYYPKGFAVFWDNELVARTTSRKTLMTNVTEGTHSYTVASLFRGDNMSAGVSGTVTVSAAAITSANATSASVVGRCGAVSVSDFNGVVAITDLCGRTVAHAECRGALSLDVQPGVYVVTLYNDSEHISTKVTVF